MNRFSLAVPKTFEEASALMTDKRFSLPVIKAGGIDVLDHLKEGLIQPDVLVNIRRLRAEGWTAPIVEIEGKSPRVRIEVETTLSEIAASDILRRIAPVVAQSIEFAASLQIRNVATAGGNLLQRPRCWYYRHEQFDCLKKGGSTCFAVDGENNYHAIFGDGPCHIVHPSNLAPALMVCDGIVSVIGGDRSEIPIADLYHMPDKGVRSENNLKPGEIITRITVGSAPTSGFYAIKEKQSFDWPLVNAAVVLDMDGTIIKSARVCAGAVAPIPWRLPKVEAALVGVDVVHDGELRQACALAIDGAKPMSGNAYKLKMLPVAVRRATLIAAGMKTEVDA